MKRILLLLFAIFIFTNCSYAENAYIARNDYNHSNFIGSTYLCIDSIKINGEMLEYKEGFVFNTSEEGEHKLIKNIEFNMKNNHMKCVLESFLNGKSSFKETTYNEIFYPDISCVYVKSIYMFLKEQNFLKNVLLFNLIVFILLLVFLVLFYEMKLKKIKTKNVESSNKSNM